MAAYAEGLEHSEARQRRQIASRNRRRDHSAAQSRSLPIRLQSRRRHGSLAPRQRGRFLAARPDRHLAVRSARLSSVFPAASPIPAKAAGPLSRPSSPPLRPRFSAPLFISGSPRRVKTISPEKFCPPCVSSSVDTSRKSPDASIWKILLASHAPEGRLSSMSLNHRRSQSRWRALRHGHLRRQRRPHQAQADSRAVQSCRRRPALQTIRHRRLCRQRLHHRNVPQDVDGRNSQIFRQAHRSKTLELVHRPHLLRQRRFSGRPGLPAPRRTDRRSRQAAQHAGQQIFLSGCRSQIFLSHRQAARRSRPHQRRRTVTGLASSSKNPSATIWNPPSN